MVPVRRSKAASAYFLPVNKRRQNAPLVAACQSTTPAAFAAAMYSSVRSAMKASISSP